MPALRAIFLILRGLLLTHLSLEGNSPVPRRVAPVSKGRVVAIPKVGGSIMNSSPSVTALTGAAASGRW